MRTLVKDAYKRFEFWIDSVPFGVSATHIFDNSKDSIFLDWTHVNARGNELIANFIFEELKRRKLLVSPKVFQWINTQL